MKKILIPLFTFAAILVASVTAFAAPQIAWLSFVHDFGPFNEDDGEAVCHFRFINTGDEPLVILSARASCGCTQPSYPREAVAPGDTATVTVAYNPAGRPGRFSKSVYIESNASTPKSKLTIKGVVIGGKESVAGRYPVDKGALQFRAPAVIFGQVMRPHLKTVFAEAYNQSSDTLPLKVLYKPRFIDVAFEPKEAVPGEQLSIICYLRTNEAGLYGLVEDSLTISAGNDRFSIPVSAVVNEDFSRLTQSDYAKAPVATFDRQSLDFGRIDKNSGSQTLTLTLGNAGKNSLEVRRVYTTDPGISVSVDRNSIKKGKTATLSVTVDPTAIPGDILNARINLITNDPINPTTTIRAVGQLLKP